MEKEFEMNKLLLHWLAAAGAGDQRIRGCSDDTK